MSELTMIRTDCENEFDRVYRDARFFATLMEQNREMENFVNESLIKASGNKRAINEMYIINEAAAGDKIKGFFEKIKNFFKKIFDKLGASMNALFAEQKKYIEKYQYIITKCKWQVGDISDIFDHFKGIPRIIDAVDNAETAILSTNADKYLKGDSGDLTYDDTQFLNLNDFESAQSIQNALNTKKAKKVLSPEEIRTQQFDEFLKGSYWNQVKDFTKENDGNGNPSPSDSFKAWFNGSVDTVSYSGDEVENNFQTVINTVYAGQSYLTKLEKIVSTVNKKMDSAAKTMEDYYKAQSDKIMKAVKQEANTKDDKGNEVQANNKDQTIKWDDNNVKSHVINNPGAPSTTEYYITINGKTYKGSSATDVKNAVAADYTLESYNYLHEEPKFGNGSSSNSENQGQPLTGAGNQEVNRAGEANTAISKTNANKMSTVNIANTSGVDDTNKDSVSKQAQELLDMDIKNRQAVINADIMISTSLTSCLFNAFKLTNKDFFSIIQAHVQWYLSNPGAEKQSENITTRTRSLDMNATGGTVNKQTQNP